MITSKSNLTVRFIAVSLLLAPVLPMDATAGFASPESLVRNIYAFYGNGTDAVSHGLPHDEDTTRQFFDSDLQRKWLTNSITPYDFFVQAKSWQLGPVAIKVTRRQYDRVYVQASFANHGRPVSLNIIAVNRDDGWVVTDAETSYDSLRMFLEKR